MPEANHPGDSQPEFIIAGGKKAFIEITEAVVQFAAPHRLRAGQAVAKQSPPVKRPRLETAGDGCPGERGILLLGDGLRLEVLEAAAQETLGVVRRNYRRHFVAEGGRQWEEVEHR